ncbi:MAG: Tetratricopeptide repeat-containing protein [Cyanobacteriota bacterium erpe_2018_sw_21hr_WHONDRS-SW48-000092_B_bin.40]|jgi:tetratricopeptide (TPR) repeat protein|nr:Tetratricopeptide repeat-containing protein [Cyanobacteriota bacterium erpe_2018_sw_21hr_WHONDRS-SW48-000092_B_bin.40]
MKVLQSASRTFSGQYRWSIPLLLALLLSSNPSFGLHAADESEFWYCPPHLESLRRQIQSQTQNDNFDTVVSLATKAIAASPKTASFYAKRAEAYLILNKPDLAMVDLTTAATLQPKIGWPLIARGRIYDSQGKDALALADYNRGIALGCFVGYKDQARVLERNGQLEKAAVSLTKLMPTIGPLERIPYLFQRAKIYEKLGKTELAKADNKLASDLVDKSGGKNADRYNR